MASQTPRWSVSRHPHHPTRQQKCVNSSTVHPERSNKHQWRNYTRAILTELKTVKTTKSIHIQAHVIRHKNEQISHVFLYLLVCLH